MLSCHLQSKCAPRVGYKYGHIALDKLPMQQVTSGVSSIIRGLLMTCDSARDPQFSHMYIQCIPSLPLNCAINNFFLSADRLQGNECQLTLCETQIKL